MISLFEYATKWSLSHSVHVGFCHQLTDTFSGQHQTLDFSKCATDNCSKFCYERKESGEPCVLRVSQLGATELVWGHNGTVIHRGQDNCVEFTASYHTAGIYICFQKGAEKLLLVHVISMKEKEKGEVM